MKLVEIEAWVMLYSVLVIYFPLASVLSSSTEWSVYYLSLEIYKRNLIKVKTPPSKKRKEKKKSRKTGPYNTIEIIFYYVKGKCYSKIYPRSRFYRHCFSRPGYNTVMTMVMVGNTAHSVT